MKKIILAFFVFGSISAFAIAENDCAYHISKIEDKKAKFLAYDALLFLYESEIEDKERLNNSFFGDYLVSDEGLNFHKASVKNARTTVKLLESLYLSEIVFYTSCLSLKGIFIEREQVQDEIDEYQVNILRQKYFLEASSINN